MDQGSICAFEAVLNQLKNSGVEIIRRADDRGLEAFEQTLIGLSKLNLEITAWENQWALRNILLSSSDPDILGAFAKATIATAERLGLDGYERSLRMRDIVLASFAAVEKRFDAFISPSSKGSAPRIDVGADLKPGEGFPTGDPVFNTPSSLLGACAVTSPLTSVGGLPMGIQLMGPSGADARITAIANWMRGAIAPVCF